METNGTHGNDDFSSKAVEKLLDSSKKVVEADVNEGEKDDEADSLLSPRKGGMSKKPKMTKRKVQWNDRNGNKLVEVLEFQPSDTSDSDDEDSDSCICTIM